MTKQCILCKVIHARSRPYLMPKWGAHVKTMR